MTEQEAIDELAMLERIVAFISHPYVLFGIYWNIGSLIISYFGLMRGKCPPYKMAHVLLRCFFLSFALFWAFQLKSLILITFFLLWTPIYLDMSEHHWGATAVSSALKLPRVWKRVRENLKPRLIKTVDIKEQCVFGLHPHGFLPIVGVLNTAVNNDEFNKQFPEQNKRVIIAGSACFVWFLIREILISAGVVDCSPFNFESWLNQGYSVLVFPGGAHEALYAQPHDDRLDLKRKRGFIRMAMKRGVRVVPCYTFNEVDGWEQIEDEAFGPVGRTIRWAWNKFWGLTLPFLLHLTPTWKPDTLVTVVGEPIEVSHDSNPSEEVLSHYSDIYMKALVKLYNEHAHLYNTQHKTIEIVS